MTTELDTRLARALDDAAAHTIADDNALDAIIRLANSRRTHRQRQPGRSVAVGAATVVAATAVVTLAVIDRSAAPTGPGQTPSSTQTDGASGLVAYPDAWTPVELAGGVVPWYQLDSVTAAEFGATEFGPAALNARCTDWAADDPESITCNFYFTEGLLPAVVYNDREFGRFIEISTIHDDTTAADYAVYFSQGKDTGYDDPPLIPEPIDVGERTGQLIEVHPGETYTTRRITVEMAPGVFVAVETMGYTLDELVAFAEHLEPATVQIPIPLDLASVTVGGVGYELSGAVVNGEVCLLSSQWTNGGPRDCTLLGDANLIVLPTDSAGFYTGLVSDKVASITITYADGTSADATPTSQPVGDTQAFAIVGEQPAVSIIAVDPQGNELARSELDPTGIVPTTMATT